ncbi:uncharacterized protein LOC119865541 [Canis lupus familiaris]|uniref:uncharacterized protein LOC119865541 n=1 Tax=Canis lupus familiaris TaxID=9615 RepID=UPI0015F13D56|nr:uncharacterized protein LOC119865541 [Canis lupus familiaris]XP_038313733.1 uncharacterized protein LOC119865541 [Canis lupus familiaris]XP_038427292.1 uncharacterized protein LOC119865541 [Canis lupus familiaris]
MQACLHTSASPPATHITHLGLPSAVWHAHSGKAGPHCRDYSLPKTIPGPLCTCSFPVWLLAPSHVLLLQQPHRMGTFPFTFQPVFSTYTKGIVLSLCWGLLLSGPSTHCSRGWRATALSELAQSPSWATEWPRTEALAPQGGRPGCQVALHLGDGDLGLSTLLSEGPGLRTPNGLGVEHTTEERGRRVPHGTCSGRGGGRPHQGSADLSRLRAPGVHAMFRSAALGLAPGRR